MSRLSVADYVTGLWHFGVIAGVIGIELSMLIGREFLGLRDTWVLDVTILLFPYFAVAGAIAEVLGRTRSLYQREHKAAAVSAASIAVMAVAVVAPINAYAQLGFAGAVLVAIGLVALSPDQTLGQYRGWGDRVARAGRRVLRFFQVRDGNFADLIFALIGLVLIAIVFVFVGGIVATALALHALAREVVLAITVPGWNIEFLRWIESKARNSRHRIQRDVIVLSPEYYDVETDILASAVLGRREQTFEIVGHSFSAAIPKNVRAGVRFRLSDSAQRGGRRVFRLVSFRD